MPIEVRFLSSNEFKINETSQILSKHQIQIIPIKEKIEELQTEKMERLVRDKVLKAYKMVRRPLFVEHTGLFLGYVNDLPGGLTQIFWDTLKADRFADIFGNAPETSVTARTIIGYIDTKKIYTFRGEIKGKIASKPIGSRDFQWDCVFVPNGHTETFALLGEKKNDISMRSRALDEFADFLIRSGGKHE